MGLRGPKPQLGLLKELDGNPGRKPILEASGIMALGEPELIEKLNKDADNCFNKIKLSMPAEVYSTMDSYLLTAYAMTWAILLESYRRISAEGFAWIVINDKGTPSESPWLKIQNKHALQLATIGDRLGLDPKSRATLHLPGAVQKKSKFDGLIGAVQTAENKGVVTQ